LEKVSSSVSSALELFANDFAPELVAVDLREAIVSVDEITGRYIQTDALDEIFSNYCIGK
jgi:tRNA modification GTPase